LADLLLSRTPSRDDHRVDPVQKQVPGEWMTQKGLTNQGPLQKPGWSVAQSGPETASIDPGFRFAPSGLRGNLDRVSQLHVCDESLLVASLHTKAWAYASVMPRLPPIVRTGNAGDAVDGMTCTIQMPPANDER